MRFKYKLSFQDLATLGGKHEITAVNSAGLANQLRCILGIMVRGHIPLTLDDERQRRKRDESEGIHLAQILKGLSSTTQQRFRLRYNDWVLQLPILASDDAELFNNLNWYGLINAAGLVRLKEKTNCYRKAFEELLPTVTRNDIPTSISRAPLGVHLRMFGRNYKPVFSVDHIGSEYIGRYYSKQAWSEERLATLVDTVLLVSERGDTVSIYTDDQSHPVVTEFASRASREGRNVFMVNAPSDLSHSEKALYELVSLSTHRKLVMTATSTYSHLAALLSEDLELAISV